MKNNILYFVVFAFLITPTVYAQDEDALEREVEMNEGAGEGDIEEQIQTGADEAALLNEEAEVIELENEALEGEIMEVQKVPYDYKTLFGEDQQFHVIPDLAYEHVWCSVECKSEPPGAQIYIIPKYDWEDNLGGHEDIAWLSKYRKGDTPYVWKTALRQRYWVVFILGERRETRPIDVIEDKDTIVEVIFQ